MRDYSKVSPQFWIGTTGKKLRAKGTSSQLVAMYLMTCPHANMLGLYYLPKIYISHECGLTIEEASMGLAGAIEADFCRYDDDSEMVWVPEMAAYQIAASLSSGDKRCLGVQNEYNGLPANPYLGPFFDKYGVAFNMTKKRHFRDEVPSPLQAPPKRLASQEQEQEQEQEQKQEQEHAQEQGTKPVSACEERHEDFEELWAAYPKRPGASKADSLKAWKARIKAGATATEILDGVWRYAAYVAASRTEHRFIKQPQTFLGNGEHYKSDWTVGARNARFGAETIEQKNARVMAEFLGVDANDSNTFEMEV